MVTFYYASRAFNPLPKTIEEYNEWQTQLARESQLLGPACWVVQTFLQLRARGYPCQLAQERPCDGIVIAHYDDMPASARDLGQAYWVCVLADRKNVHPLANFYVVQNPYQRVYTFQPTLHILHWTQPGLEPRDGRRGQTFENVRFFGEHLSLCDELRDSRFAEWCTSERLNFQIVARDLWSDYSDCDVAIAIRNPPDKWVHDKPPSKLVNAWQACVPAILGRESSYRAMGTPGTDYIEVGSVQDLKRELLRLRDRPVQVSSLVSAGQVRMESISEHSIAAMWLSGLTHEISPEYKRWKRSLFRRAWHRVRRRVLEGLAWRYQLLGTKYKDLTSQSSKRR